MTIPTPLRNILHSLLLMALGIITSCSLIYPAYKRPAIPIPNHWSIESLSLKTENNLPLLAWWNQFNDKVLNHLIQCGLQVNNTVGEARSNIERAQGELRSVQLSWLPSFDMLAGFSQNPNFGSPGLFYGIYPGYFALNIFYTLAREKSARIQVEAQHYVLDATNLVLIGQIAKSYYSYIAALEALKLYNQYETHLQELLDIQTEDYKGGINTLITVQVTRQRLNQVKSQRYVTENNIVKSQNALRYLINQNPGPIPKGRQFATMNTLYPEFATLPATVLSDRPDVAFSEAQYRIAVQNIGVATTQLLPRVQLDYFYGHVQKSPLGKPLRSPATFADAYPFWIVNPSVFGDIMAFTGAQKAAYYNYIDTVKNALREVDNDLSTHQKANQRFLSTQEAYQAARKKDQLNGDLYRQGIIAYQALLYDKLVVDEAALELNEIKLVQMGAIISLYQDLGGGYKACTHNP